MDIVEADMQGAPVIKTRVYKDLAEKLGRAPKAVEYKMLNVSGALVDMGFGFARGLAPARNFQRSLIDLVHLEGERRPEALAYLARRKASGAATGRSPSRADVPWVAPDREKPSREQSETFYMHLYDLWDLGTGGSDVAASPDTSSNVPHAPTPAAVDQAASWLQQALAGETKNRRMLFLVGGPGGGKSFVASRITGSLERLDGRKDGLAHREYSFMSPGGELILINDATIPPEERSGRAGSTLSADIQKSLNRHLLACVNRGVLVDELSAEDRASAGSMVSSWLRGEESEEPEGLPWSRLTVIAKSEYLRQATLVSGGSTIELMAVYVDVCSLLEPVPDCNLRASGLLDGEPYKLRGFESKSNRLDTPAGELLSSVVDHLSWPAEFEYDPIAANLQTLSQERPRNGLLTILRSGEILTSQRLTFRELWGAIARCVAGSLPETMPPEHLVEWILTNTPDSLDDPRTAFEKVRRLAAVRFWQALFGEPAEAATRHPVLRLTASADPARDMIPGKPDDQGDGWATPVTEAFSSAELGDSPLQTLLLSAGTPQLEEAVTAFDRLLDDRYVEAMHHSTDSRWSSEATAWYGTYLTRMLAVCLGYPAFKADVSSWVEAWRLSPGLPEVLRNRLETLISPPRDPETSSHRSQVPLFAARAEAIRGRPDSPVLALDVEDIDLETHRDGETLLLRISRKGEEVGVVQLDLNLVREAMACAGGWVGMTDATDSTVPRLERFRSLQLLASHRGASSIRIVTPIHEYQVTVAGKGL
ncbi:hypothetical protein ACXR8F_20735 [Terrabacter sp. AAH1]